MLKCRALGFTLVELMIAITIGLLIMTALLQMYSAMQESYKFQHELITMQNNAQSALAILQQEIQMAGYVGCARKVAHLEGDDHQVVIKHASYPPAQVIRASTDKYTLEASNQIIFKPNNLLSVSDCSHAEIRATEKILLKRKHQNILFTQPLIHTYQYGAEIANFEINKFTVRSGMLIFIDAYGKQQKLIDGVRDLSFRYACMNAGKITLKSAQQITDWLKVVGVFIDLELLTKTWTQHWYAYVQLQNA